VSVSRLIHPTLVKTLITISRVRPARFFKDVKTIKVSAGDDIVSIVDIVFVNSAITVTGALKTMPITARLTHSISKAEHSYHLRTLAENTNSCISEKHSAHTSTHRNYF